MSELLLAKPTPDLSNPYYASTLQGHLRQVLDIATVICERSGAQIVRACGSEDPEHIERFGKVLRLAAVLHDIGKCSSLFQQMVKTGKRVNQTLRHEVISYWIVLNHQGLQKAIRSYLGVQHDADWSFIALYTTILGHHFKYPRQPKNESGFHPEISLHLDELETNHIFSLIESVVEQPIERTSLPSEVTGTTEWWFDNIKDTFDDMLDSISLSETERNLCSMIRGMFIAIDTLGSVQSISRSEWEKVKLPLLVQSIYQNTLQEVLGQLIEGRMEGNVPNPEITAFQTRVADSKANVTIVEAGCGSGKTLAAYRWGLNQQTESLFITYPTTSTATQGYVDYAVPVSDHVQLLHSRSLIDMELLLTDVEDNETGEMDQLHELYSSLERLSNPVTLSTVDSVVGVVQNHRSCLCLLPKLVQGAVVFDEVHCYDETLFANFLEFLRKIRIPTLIMTASLQPNRRRALEETLKDRTIQWVNGPEQQEQLPRYHINVATNFPEERVIQALQENEKVLIVVNRVEDAKHTYDHVRDISSHINAKGYVYHSRFKYEDRVQRQQEVVEAFRGDQAVFVVTTQICELSFDVSADLLVSQLAPFPSTIQRLGRLNRRARVGSPCKEAWFYESEKSLPYDQLDLDRSREWLESLVGASVSQADLSNLLAQETENRVRLLSQVEVDWAELSQSQRNNPIRSAGYTMECIAESDYHEYRSSGLKELGKRTLPLPSYRILDEWRRWKHVVVVPDFMIKYSKEIGGGWIS